MKQSTFNNEYDILNGFHNHLHALHVLYLFVIIERCHFLQRQLEEVRHTYTIFN